MRLLCAAAFVLLHVTTALAQDGATRQTTIDELLRLDSQAALLAARKNIFGLTQHAQAVSGTDAHPPESNQVLAIYGLSLIHI